MVQTGLLRTLWFWSLSLFHHLIVYSYNIHGFFLRSIRKRKASEPLGTAKRSKVQHGSDVAKKENSEQLYLVSTMQQ